MGKNKNSGRKRIITATDNRLKTWDHRPKNAVAKRTPTEKRDDKILRMVKQQYADAQERKEFKKNPRSGKQATHSVSSSTKLDSRKSSGSASQQGEEEQQQVKHVANLSSKMFFSYNTALGPPYHILMDTNFINFSVQNKLDIYQTMMDTLYAKCIPCVTDCVIGELEKLGHKFRIALRVAKDPRFKRLTCSHQGTYADDCICERVSKHRCFIVATCDRDLKRRLRKIPGVPLMFIKKKQYYIERLPDVTGIAPFT